MRQLLDDVLFVLGVFLSVGLLAVALVAVACSPVRGHEFYDGWCCNNRDCQPIPSAAVETTALGYRVSLKPAEHGMLKAETTTHTYLVPYADAKVSPDGRFHACIYPDVDTMRCFYAPPVGS